MEEAAKEAKTLRDSALARYAPVLSHRAFSMPIPRWQGRTEGLYASRRRACRRTQQHTYPRRLPPQPVDRLPAGVRRLPQLRVGARPCRAVSAYAQYAPNRRPQRGYRRRDEAGGADL